MRKIVFLVAEVGGFLGMILGVSILDLEVVIKFVLSMSQDQKIRVSLNSM